MGWGAGSEGGGSPAAAPPFVPGRVLRLELTLPSEGVEKLRANRRQNVRGMLREGSGVALPVQVHLKGTRGSLRGIDDKPSFTLDFGPSSGEAGASVLFHGLRKVHLNNSVEDPGYLNEALGAALFRSAGVPSPLVGHAWVRFNGRDLGLFVLKEGFAEEFLERSFTQAGGVIYEPGTGHDVDEPLARRFGPKGGEDLELRTLAEAVREPNLRVRGTQLQKVLDVDRFLSFAAIEVIAGHRDGYCLAKNNFRLYLDPGSHRFVFLPTGMDQLLGNPEARWRPEMAGVVARSMMELPEVRSRYRARVGELVTNVFDVARLTAEVTGWLDPLRKELSPEAGATLEAEGKSLLERICLRRAYLDQQLAIPDLRALMFTNGVASVAGWAPVDPPAGGSMTRERSPDGVGVLQITAGPRTAASWRSTLLLEPGRYRFEGRVRTTGVQPLPFGKRQGACLRLAENPSAISPVLLAETPWRSVATPPFVIQGAPTEIEVLCELRASAGTASFDAASLRLIQIPPDPEDHGGKPPPLR